MHELTRTAEGRATRSRPRPRDRGHPPPHVAARAARRRRSGRRSAAEVARDDGGRRARVAQARSPTRRPKRSAAARPNATDSRTRWSTSRLAATRCSPTSTRSTRYERDYRETVAAALEADLDAVRNRTTGSPGRVARDVERRAARRREKASPVGVRLRLRYRHRHRHRQPCHRGVVRARRRQHRCRYCSRSQSMPIVDVDRCEDEPQNEAADGPETTTESDRDVGSFFATTEVGENGDAGVGCRRRGCRRRGCADDDVRPKTPVVKMMVGQGTTPSNRRPRRSPPTSRPAR